VRTPLPFAGIAALEKDGFEMVLKTYGSSAAILRQLLEQKAPVTPKIPFAPQKPDCREDGVIAQPFPRCSPEEAGVPSSLVTDFLTELARDESLDPHTVLLARNGRIISQTAFGGYDPGVWNLTHSECKSITSLAIGMLLDEGRLSLDDRVLDLFADRTDKGSLAQLAHKELTVRHLLTMTSLAPFNETGSVTEMDWVGCFLQDMALSEPGKAFQYNSMNTYMLSAIVRRVTGQGLTDYLRPRLFEPLGITDIFWEKCPAGIEKGGWGLYIRPEDIAKIGQLVLQEGVWQGRRLISAEYLRQATAPQVRPTVESDTYDYGYQIWVGRENGAFLFNGMFGQNVMGFPKTGLLLVTTAGNSELFQQSGFYTLADRFFGRDFHPADAPLPPDEAALEKLRALEKDPGAVRRRRRGSVLQALLDRERAENTAELCAQLCGKTFWPDPADTACTGLLPSFVQAIQNNYTAGLRSLSFAVRDGRLFLTVNEADCSHCLPIGFDAPERCRLNFSGETELVSVRGALASDEDDVPVLKIRISFLELSSSRMIKLFFFRDHIHVRWLETPGKAFLDNGLFSLRRQLAPRLLIGGLVSRSGRSVERNLQRRIDGVLNRAFDLWPEPPDHRTK